MREEAVTGAFTRLIGVMRTEEGLPVLTVLEREAEVRIFGDAGLTEGSEGSLQYSMQEDAALMVTSMKNRKISISSGDIKTTSKSDRMFFWR